MNNKNDNENKNTIYCNASSYSENIVSITHWINYKIKNINYNSIILYMIKLKPQLNFAI